MAGEGKEVDLWKVVAGFGGATFALGAQMMVAGVAPEGIILVIGGLALFALAILWAMWERYEWRRPPRLPRALTCSHYPREYFPDLPGHPYSQHLSLGVERTIYPPDIRVECSGAVLRIEAAVIDHERLLAQDEPRGCTRYRSSIDAVSLHFPPLEPLKPPNAIMLRVFSDQPLRVRRIRLPKPKYKPTPPSVHHLSTTAPASPPPSSPESSE